MLDFTLTLVSNDRDTLQGVHELLTRHGARFSSMSRLDRVSEEVDATVADAVIVFADGYLWEDVLRVVQALSCRLVVLISSCGAEYTAALAEAPPVVVLPRSISGWVLIDALRVGVRLAPRRPGTT